MQTWIKSLLVVGLLCVGCSSDSDSGKKAQWESSDLASYQTACASTLRSKSIDEAKVDPICGCWVNKIAHDFSPEEADLDENTNAIRNLLNTCGRENGLPGNLGFVNLFKSILGHIRSSK